MKIKEAVIVEGKYDKIKLDFIEGLVIPVDGFSIFGDEDKIDLLRKICQKQGIIILTDSDSAGFRLRTYLKNVLKEHGEIKHAFIPDILGKEKRKVSPSKEGKLGVEGIDIEILKKAILKCTKETKESKEMITKADLYEHGFFGNANSSEKRKKLCKALNLPERISAKMLTQIISCEEFVNICQQF